MGSSTNGVTRGQLRPYIGSRGPPFVICGLFVFLIIVGYSYWNLSFRFNILHSDFINLEEKLRNSATKNDQLVKQNEALSENLQKDEVEIQKMKTLLTKKDEELLQVSSQLRSKEDEIIRINSQVEALKTESEKYKQAHDDLKIIKDQLDAELKQLKEKNSAQEQIINDAKVANKQSQGDQNPVKQQQPPVLKEHENGSVKKVDQPIVNNELKQKDQEQKPEPPLDPNVDIPNNIEQNTL